MELVENYVDRIETLNPQLDAFVTPTLELAVEQAKSAETEIAAGNHKGPLHGVPFRLERHLRDQRHPDVGPFESDGGSHPRAGCHHDSEVIRSRYGASR